MDANNVALPDFHTSPMVGIIVVNWNGWRDTLACLNSVLGLDYPNYLTIVLENGSTNDSLSKIRGWAAERQPKYVAVTEYSVTEALLGGQPQMESTLDKEAPQKRIVLIKSSENLGFTGAANAAIAYALRRPAPCNFVFLLNNDGVVQVDGLSHLVEVAAKSKAGIVGAVIREKSEKTLRFVGFNGNFPRLREFFTPLFHWAARPSRNGSEYWPSYRVNGAGMLISKESLEAVHGSRGYYFWDALFLYFEEVDFCVYARKLGFESVMTRTVALLHGGSSSSGGPYRPLPYYYMTRNRVLLARKLLPFTLQILFHAYNILACFGRVVKTHFMRRPNSALAVRAGFRDGLGGVTGKWRLHDQMAQISN